MKKSIVLFLVCMCVLSCSFDKVHSEKSEPDNTRLPLTKENLAGKWSLEENNIVWIEFTVDLTCKNSVETGTYSIIDSKTIKVIWKDVLNITTEKNHNIIIYKNYIVIDKRKFIKSI